ncbi:universal stress protein [Maribacter halichondriae]|uniref:universal stress protein n=1 Tax=Maribacter halichondriae TaxID=2980554 RepID=UPI002359B908|nr:universal stress protein [Maribacter sp. Hal144]
MAEVEKLPLNPKHTFVTLALHDYFVDAIKRESENKKIDLIVMGTKGATGLKKATVGSNTGDVITKIKQPLLAVPEDTVYEKPREIAFATDYHIGYDAKGIGYLDTYGRYARFDNTYSAYFKKRGAVDRGTRKE